MGSSYIGKLETITDQIRERGLYPDIPIVESAATEPEVMIGGEKYLLFSSNNYLGMSHDSRVIEAMVAAANKYGLGTGGPRLLAGNLDVQNELEANIAEFTGREAAMCVTTGYMTNEGLIPALCDPMRIDLRDNVSSFVEEKLLGRTGTDIISEEKNHGSIVDGARLAKADRYLYKHKDIDDLALKLRRSRQKRKLVITDGVFSMDGDIAPLDKIVSLAKSYDAMIMVDDAHGFGTLGKNGRGSMEQHSIAPGDVDVLMGTFTKAFGGIGGFVVGTKKLVEYLKITTRTYLLSAPIPPSISAGLSASIKIVAKEAWRREKAWENVTYFRERMEKLNFNTLKSETLICPVLIGDELKAIEASKFLKTKNIIAPNARYPSVAVGNARLRFVFTALHEKEKIDYLIQSLEEMREALRI